MDFRITFDGGSYNTAILKSTSERLIATLFYLEISIVPRFYSSPEQCHVKVQCRVPPGHALLDLLYQLERHGTRLYYRGDELLYTDVPLVEHDVVQTCRGGNSFCKMIALQVYSLRSTLDVKIGSVEGPNFSISRCPYELQALIRDQRLDDPFNRSDQLTPYDDILDRKRGQEGLQGRLNRAFAGLDQTLKQLRLGL